jgi:hypothetical protein
MFTACVCIDDCLLSRWSGLKTIRPYKKTNAALVDTALVNAASVKNDVYLCTYVNFLIFFCHCVNKKKACYMAPDRQIINYLLKSSTKTNREKTLNIWTRIWITKYFFFIMIYFGKKWGCFYQKWGVLVKSMGEMISVIPDNSALVFFSLILRTKLPIALILMFWYLFSRCHKIYS